MVQLWTIRELGKESIDIALDCDTRELQKALEFDKRTSQMTWGKQFDLELYAYDTIIKNNFQPFLANKHIDPMAYRTWACDLNPKSLSPHPLDYFLSSIPENPLLASYPYHT